MNLGTIPGWLRGETLTVADRVKWLSWLCVLQSEADVLGRQYQSGTPCMMDQHIFFPDKGTWKTTNYQLRC